MLGVRLGGKGQDRMVINGRCWREMRAGNLARPQRGRTECGTHNWRANSCQGSTAQWMDGWI